MAQSDYDLDEYDETTQGDTATDLESSVESASNKSGIGVSGLNRKLRTEFIDLDPEDESLRANIIRGIVGLVGALFSPRQILVALRLLKAVTVSMIALTATANVTYVAMVEFVAQPYANYSYFGIRRDTVLRVYGLGLSVLALMIEMDKFTMKNFKVLKGFLARFVLLFFVACLTYVHPQQWANANTSVPGSAVMFQMVCSMMLACCSFFYAIFGLLCLDRFTSRAFLSTQDPVKNTQIPGRNYEAPSY
mmetsp:Transcript_24645/g.40653  ORF Transcript_24645/g.40653 Transcript_24645/m.40653 type:complete len:249 (+) Transcript_24645:194-940(+)